MMNPTTKMFNEENYRKNLDLLAKTDHLIAKQLEFLKLENKITVCETALGEPNLCQKKYGVTAYYHAHSGALEECKASITEEIQKEGQTLFVYGLGLGYFYTYLEEWLNEKSGRSLIFLEDDLEVIIYFLHTDRATKLLEDPRVVLFHFQNYEKCYLDFFSLFASFAQTKANFIVLPFYANSKSEKAFTLGYNILHDFSLINGVLIEFLTGQAGFNSNFYKNLFHFPQSYLAHGMFKQFKNIPAIICGAGPSIHQNIHLLHSIKNKAVIFAGGSSLNILNHFGINPHFGIGVDPNKEQKHRLMTNDTFHIPYFYRPRVAHEAFKLMQGPKMYVSGSDNLISNWFEEEFNMTIPLLDEGHNVITLSTGIAQRMGFNPIIYIGMDLAFSEIQSYASGIHTHPLWVEQSRPYSIEKQVAVNRFDIYGKPIYTKWDWIGEANWLAQFAKQHPTVTMINASEGGLGFNVPHMKLQDAIDRYLTKNYDLSGLIHTEIQNNPTKIKTPALIQAVTKLKNSFDRCLTCLREIISEKKKMVFSTFWLNRLTSPSQGQSEFYTTSTILKDCDIQSELAYQKYIKIVGSAKEYLCRSHRRFKKKCGTYFSEQLANYEFLEASARQHIQYMTDAFQYFLYSQQQSNEQTENKDASVENEIYSFEEGHLKIHVPYLDISIDDFITPLDAIKCQKSYYDDQSIKQETYYFNNELNGPSRFYSSTGQLLSESWFFNNKQEGKAVQYYSSGQLYCLKHYKDSQLHGDQKYFHENGTLSVSMHYEHGVLDGPVETYTQNGNRLRQLTYHEGKRDGKERMWHTNGQLLYECDYENGIPTGEAKEWTPTGWLFKEVKIIHYPDLFDVTIYNKEGAKVQIFENGLEDHSLLYNRTQKRIDKIEADFKTIFEQMDPYFQDHLEEMAVQNPAIFQELIAIKKSREEMDHLSEMLRETMKTNISNFEEAKQKLKDS